jgi:hypothetical protein
MMLGGGGKRRDANEREIRRVLHAAGAQTWQINGAHLPDLLVLYRGRWKPLGIKTLTGRLRPGEGAACWPIVRTAAEACTACGVGGYTTGDKNRKAFPVRSLSPHALRTKGTR